MQTDAARSLGLDFGTTNTVGALSGGALSGGALSGGALSGGALSGGAMAGSGTAPTLIRFAGPDAVDDVFRSALCFWEDEDAAGGIAAEAGPWAIAEYLAYPQGCRFIQSFKSVAASRNFETASILGKRFSFEALGRLFLDRLATHSGGCLAVPPQRVVVGRPVTYAGSSPDAALARERYGKMFAGFGGEIHYVYEPLAAAFSYAARLADEATVLVADFGGGTSDFSIVHMKRPGEAQRFTPLGHAGIGIAGDDFDFRLLDRLVLPRLGKGGEYRSFDKRLVIPGSYFADFANWSRLALMRNRRTMEELRRLQHQAIDPEAIARLIAVIENELGYPLYEAIGRLKRALSQDQRATFTFQGGGLDITAEVSRAEFEAWIGSDLARIEACVDDALTAASLTNAGIDRVFLTGGSSLIPAVRAMFERRFGPERVAVGGELTSIAQGLALIGERDDVAEWAV